MRMLKYPFFPKELCFLLKIKFRRLNYSKKQFTSPYDLYYHLSGNSPTEESTGLNSGRQLFGYRYNDIRIAPLYASSERSVQEPLLFKPVNPKNQIDWLKRPFWTRSLHEVKKDFNTLNTSVYQHLVRNPRYLWSWFVDSGPEDLIANDIFYQLENKYHLVNLRLSNFNEIKRHFLTMQFHNISSRKILQRIIVLINWYHRLLKHRMYLLWLGKIDVIEQWWNGVLLDPVPKPEASVSVYQPLYSKFWNWHDNNHWVTEEDELCTYRFSRILKEEEYYGEKRWSWKKFKFFSYTGRRREEEVTLFPGLKISNAPYWWEDYDLKKNKHFYVENNERRYYGVEWDQFLSTDPHVYAEYYARWKEANARSPIKPLDPDIIPEEEKWYWATYFKSVEILLPNKNPPVYPGISFQHFCTTDEEMIQYDAHIDRPPEDIISDDESVPKEYRIVNAHLFRIYWEDWYSYCFYDPDYKRVSRWKFHRRGEEFKFDIPDIAVKMKVFSSIMEYQNDEENTWACFEEPNFKFDTVVKNIYPSHPEYMYDFEITADDAMLAFENRRVTGFSKEYFEEYHTTKRIVKRGLAPYEDPWSTERFDYQKVEIIDMPIFMQEYYQNYEKRCWHILFHQTYAWFWSMDRSDVEDSHEEMRYLMGEDTQDPFTYSDNTPYHANKFHVLQISAFKQEENPEYPTFLAKELIWLDLFCTRRFDPQERPYLFTIDKWDMVWNGPQPLENFVGRLHKAGLVTPDNGFERQIWLQPQKHINRVVPDLENPFVWSRFGFSNFFRQNWYEATLNHKTNIPKVWLVSFLSSVVTVFFFVLFSLLAVIYGFPWF